MVHWLNQCYPFVLIFFVLVSFESSYKEKTTRE